MPDTGIPSLRCDQLAGRLDRFTLVDVRETAEVVHGMLPGAQHIPMGRVVENLDRHPALSNRDEDIVVYCAHGIRSAMVVQFLLEQGFSRVFNLEGGYADWEHRPGEPAVD